MRLLATAGLLLVSACVSVTEPAKPAGDAPELTTSASKSMPAPTKAQIETFGTLANYVGKTFRGEPTGDTSGGAVDIQKWEWGLDGHTLLIRHALLDGSYGGDSHVYRDAKTGKLTYVYITSGGFHTVGEMTPTDNGWVAEEAVTGHETITRVRSTSVVDENGVWTATSEYLQNGEWVPGRLMEYRETNDSLPLIKAK